MSHRQTRKKFNSLFVVNDKLKKLAKEMVDLQPLIDNPKSGVVAHMMAKGFKTYGVILNLCKNGYGEDAQMLARTLFDAYLIAATVMEDKTDKTAIQYLNFDDFTRLKMFNYVKDKDIYKKKFEQRKNNPKPKQESIKEVEERTIKWLEEYGKDFKYRWHVGKTTGELAKAVNMESYFQTAYNLQSQLVHSLARTGDFYLVDDGNRLWMKTEPGEVAVDLALVSSFNIFLGLALAFDEQFNLGHEEEIKKLIPEYSEAVNKEAK